MPISLENRDRIKQHLQRKLEAAQKEGSLIALSNILIFGEPLVVREYTDLLRRTWNNNPTKGFVGGLADEGLVEVNDETPEAEKETIFSEVAAIIYEIVKALTKDEEQK